MIIAVFWIYQFYMSALSKTNILSFKVYEQQQLNVTLVSHRANEVNAINIPPVPVLRQSCSHLG